MPRELSISEVRNTDEVKKFDCLHCYDLNVCECFILFGSCDECGAKTRQCGYHSNWEVKV